MKILSANKFYYLKGGAERHYFDLNKLLEKNSNTVIPFAMRDKKNFSSPYSKYFVSNVNIEKTGFSWQDIKAAGRIIYSFEAKEKIKKLIEDTNPNIAHIHNIYHQISPSILTVLKKKNIPIVMTVHDFKLMCPVYTFYSKGEVCERCKRYKYYNCVFRKCAKNSLLASAINAKEMYFHRFLKIYKNNIDIYISPSNFVKQKLAEYGFPEDKVVVLPHFIKNLPRYNNEQNNYSGKYILYFGRLSKGKGIMVLLKAMKELKDINLKIAGSGPLEYKLNEYVKKENITNIEFLGYLSGEKLKNTIQNSSFAITPSASYETFGLSVLESYSYGKPVIASNIGALPEIVKDGKYGYLFKSSDPGNLAKKIKKITDDAADINIMGKNAYEYASQNFKSDDYYNAIMKIYNNLLNKYKNR